METTPKSQTPPCWHVPLSLCCIFCILCSFGNFSIPSLSRGSQCQNACLVVVDQFIWWSHSSCMYVCICQLTCSKLSPPCARCWDTKINMAVSHGPQGTQSGRRDGPIHNYTTARAVRNRGCSDDTKKAIRIKELCAIFCFKMGYKIGAFF